MIHVQSFKRTCSYPSIVLFHLGNTILASPPVLLKNTAANLTALISGDIHHQRPRSHHGASSWSPSRPRATRAIPAPGKTPSWETKPVLLLPFETGNINHREMKWLAKALSSWQGEILQEPSGPPWSSQCRDQGSPSSSLIIQQHESHLQTASCEQKSALSWFTVFVPSITQEKSAVTHWRAFPSPRIATPVLLQRSQKMMSLESHQPKNRNFHGGMQVNIRTKKLGAGWGSPKNMAHVSSVVLFWVCLVGFVFFFKPFCKWKDMEGRDTWTWKIFSNRL